MSLRYVAVNWNRQKRIYDAVALAGVLGTLAVFVGVTLGAHPDATIESALIRGLGLTGLLLLHLILAIGPLARLDPRFLPLLYNRRHLGVTMAVLGAAHAGFALFQYHALGNANPLVSLLTGNRDLGSAAGFPFELLGVLALLILVLMAATSHDYWLSALTPPVWKRLHMLVYLAYAALVGHVGLGVLQDERHPLVAAALGTGALTIAGLHLAAALRERPRDRPAPRGGDGWVDVGAAAEISEGRAVTAVVGGERVAVFRHGERLSCVSNVCKHQNGPLGEGRIVDGCITCPWHGYQYRPESGASPPPFDDAVPTFRLAVSGGRVLVHERPNPPGTRVDPVPVEPAVAAPPGEFYVGYLPAAPAGLARWLRGVIVVLWLLGTGSAAMLALAQRTFEPAAFDFGREVRLAGVVRAEPFPMLEVERPGSPERVSRYLLTAAGKRGAQAAAEAARDRPVTIEGTLAYRSHLTLLEIARVTPTPGPAPPRGREPVEVLGAFQLVGEIVDGKCYAGVMNPGRGKAHRGCAARCLSGGLPPLFVLEGANAERLELLLLDPAGAPLPRVDESAGIRLALSGRVARRGDLWLLYSDPSTWRRVR